MKATLPSCGNKIEHTFVVLHLTQSAKLLIKEEKTKTGIHLQDKVMKYLVSVSIRSFFSITQSVKLVLCCQNLFKPVPLFPQNTWNRCSLPINSLWKWSKLNYVSYLQCSFHFLKLYSFITRCSF